jgi:hypothetical protein
MNLSLFYKDLLFIVTATSFFVGVGWAWRKTEPYDLPQSLPNWFRIWFLTVQIGGIGLPLLGLIWSIQKGYFNIVMILASYFLTVVLQILTESISLRWFHSTVFVMVPYLYLPYRIWQLYQGLMLLNPTDELLLIRSLLLGEIILWTANYALDLSQLPRLLRWKCQ